MPGQTDVIDRIAPTRRPDEAVVGYQCWSDLLFVHWAVPVSAIERLIPPELTIDTYDGTAWVGLIPFTMSGVRPRWFPAVPGLSAFHEFNVRTYVHRQGKDPGVWFFSLEAANSIAVRVARWKWHLPYYRAKMSLQKQERRLWYFSERLWPGEPGPGVAIEAEFGDRLGKTAGQDEAGRAVPGTLEHFLVERYFLYAKTEQGQLYRGQVHHQPYPLHAARLLKLEENLLAAAGIDRPEEPAHVAYSPGVEVEIFALRRC